MPQGSSRSLDRSAVESSAAAAAAAMWAAADSLQARLELVLDERLGALSADQRGFLQVARKDGQRLLKLIADFREIALAEAGLLQLEWTRLDLGPAAVAAADAVASRAEALGKTVAVETDAATTVSADAARVADALGRLVRHAVQQSSAGSPIELRAETGGVIVRYEADAPPPDDSLAVAFAAAIAHAHGGSLTVTWSEPRVEIAVTLDPVDSPRRALEVAA